jgi:hypothetical protein
MLELAEDAPHTTKTVLDSLTRHWADPIRQFILGEKANLCNFTVRAPCPTTDYSGFKVQNGVICVSLNVGPDERPDFDLIPGFLSNFPAQGNRRYFPGFDPPPGCRPSSVRVVQPDTEDPPFSINNDGENADGCHKHRGVMST